MAWSLLYPQSNHLFRKPPCPCPKLFPQVVAYNLFIFYPDILSYRCERGTVPSKQIQPFRVAHRRQHRWSYSHKQLHHIQLTLVLTGSVHATGCRYRTQVRTIDVLPMLMCGLKKTNEPKLGLDRILWSASYLGKVNSASIPIQVDVGSNCWQCMVVLHTHHHLIIHG